VTPVGPVNGNADDLADKNITALELEVPISCLGFRLGSCAAAALPLSRTHLSL